MTRVEIIANDRSELIAENRRLREENVRLQRRVTALENQMREQQNRAPATAPAATAAATTVAIANVARPDPLGRFQRREVAQPSQPQAATTPSIPSAPVAPSRPPAPAETDPAPPADDTAQRFSLLELD